MSLRRELVLLADQPGANVAEISRRFGVSRKTAYKWLGRYREGGDDALGDRSRAPDRSPNRTPPEVEAAVLRVRTTLRPVPGTGSPAGSGARPAPSSIRTS